MRHNKIKRLFACAFCFMFLFICSSTVFAADCTVTYSTKTSKFDFSDKDLFQNFKGIMPGDSLSQKFEVSNDTKSGVRVNLYLRAKPIEGTDELETEKYNEFLSQLKLTLTKSSTAQPLFDDMANAQGTLKDKVYLGTFYPGTKINFNVNLNVPLEMGNEFQDAMGKLTWIFTAEERPTPPPYNPPRTTTVYYEEPQPEPEIEIVMIEQEVTPSKPKTKSPQTGDNANIVLPIVLMIVSAFAIFLLFVTRKNKKDNKK